MLNKKWNPSNIIVVAIKNIVASAVKCQHSVRGGWFSPYELEIMQNPVSWQISADGTRVIGHVILQKSFDGEDILKVSGGKLLANGSRGAVVDAVKCGSIADLEGHILPGEYPIPQQNHIDNLSRRNFSFFNWDCEDG